MAFWLGFSHNGNIINSNTIAGNAVNGIEIDHGQLNIIINNRFIMNSQYGLYLQTDGSSPFPSNQYPCLMLNNQTVSSQYNITGNYFVENQNYGLRIQNTTDSIIYNNAFISSTNYTVQTDALCSNSKFYITPIKEQNIMEGPNIGGNFYSNYYGIDTKGQGFGTTNIPYNNYGAMANINADPYPIVAKT